MPGCSCCRSARDTYQNMVPSFGQQLTFCPACRLCYRLIDPRNFSAAALNARTPAALSAP
ncbi:CRISPR-associated protein [Purpureocillium lilacinum]|uniref:CRISPR-associated protein n=1 Tax=Purpureocillium lilacinum TaxID=33203 RepID=A0A179GC07_PURLI|nr:CRISPR-associated protein [Purpureocillium lilacinum]OAQ75068.1 CRISPR-associated protein [Purpureocillium lilacinum]